MAALRDTVSRPIRLGRVAELPLGGVTCPAIPFVTSAATPEATVDMLRAALRTLITEPRYASVRAGLMIAGIEDVPDAAYRGLLDDEREAGELGYSTLA